MSSKLAKIVADFQTTLATQIDVGGTTGSLQSALDADGIILPTATYFFTIDGNSTSKEHIVCVCTAGALTSISSISRQGVQTAGAVRKHRIGASVEITDFAHIKYINDLLDGTTALNGSAALKYDAEPTFTYGQHQLVTWDKSKDYTDSVAVAGAPNGDTVTKGIFQGMTGAQLAAGTSVGSTGAFLVPIGSSFKNSSAGAGDANKVPVLNGSGVLDQTFLDATRTWGAVQSFSANNAQITTDADSANDAIRQSYMQAEIPKGYAPGTSGEAFAAGAALYLKASDGRLYKSIGTGDESTFSFVGIAATAAGGAAASVFFATPGHIVTGLAGLVAGSYYYVTDVAGTIGTTPGTRYARVAQALSTTSLRVIEPKFIAKGSVTITSATTFVQTVGFRPACIQIRATVSSVQSGASIGDDSNQCIAIRLGNPLSDSNSQANAWYCYDRNAGVLRNAGNVSAYSATGFTLNCTTYGNDATVQYIAESI